MFVLIEYNKEYERNLSEIKKYDYTPVTLFKITIKDKNQFKTDLNKIKEMKNQIKPKYSAIEIILEKVDNQVTGFINHLKTEFDILIGVGGLNKVNRFFLEQTNIDFLKNPQNTLFAPKIDFIHHFNSGLNHVLCKSAKEREINFFFSLNFISSYKWQTSKEIGRINQNIKLARKYKIPILINFTITVFSQVKSLIGLSAIISIFDISTQQKKESLDLLEKIIKSNLNKKSDKYITTQIEYV